MRPLLLLPLLLLPLGCYGMQDIVNICDTDPGHERCPSCSSDEQCVVSSNTCHEKAYCHHRDVEIMLTMDGCNWSYDRPPDEDCRCIAHECRAE